MLRGRTTGHNIEVSGANGLFVITKQFRLRTFILESNRNKSVPKDTIAFVKEYLAKLGFDIIFDDAKSRGHPLFPPICAIVSYRLTENFSVKGCGRWLESSEVRNEIGIRGNVSHRMLNRAIERTGEIMPEVLTHLWKSLFSMYDLEHTDVNIDAASVSVYAKGTGLYDFGYSGDRRPDLRQVNFGAAKLRDPINIPIGLSVDRGERFRFGAVRENRRRDQSGTSATTRCSCSMP